MGLFSRVISERQGRLSDRRSSDYSLLFERYNLWRLGREMFGWISLMKFFRKLSSYKLFKQ